MILWRHKEKPKKPKKNIYVWHNWFAWRPVKTTTGTVVWLETVLRKRFGDYLPLSVLPIRHYYWQYLDKRFSE